MIFVIISITTETNLLSLNEFTQDTFRRCKCVGKSGKVLRFVEAQEIEGQSVVGLIYLLDNLPHQMELEN